MPLIDIAVRVAQILSTSALDEQCSTMAANHGGQVDGLVTAKS